MKQDTYAQGRAVEARTHTWPAKQGNGALLGSYLAETGWRELRAMETVDRGICLIDEGAEGALLVEPELEAMSEVRALAADYLDQANESGKPQTRNPWPPTTCAGEAS